MSVGLERAIGHVELPPSTPDTTIEVREIIPPRVTGVFVRGGMWSDAFCRRIA
jgi:hypothetical protein